MFASNLISSMVHVPGFVCKRPSRTVEWPVAQFRDDSYNDVTYLRDSFGRPGALDIHVS